MENHSKKKEETQYELPYKEVLPCGHENTFSHLLVTAVLMAVMSSMLRGGEGFTVSEELAIKLVEELFEKSNSKMPKVPKDLIPDEHLQKVTVQ